MRKLTMSELNRPSVEAFRGQEKLPVIVVLDNVRSMHNVGSLFRTADAFNLQAVWLCGITPAPPHREIHRTALGATESVAWKQFGNTLDAILELEAAGFRVIAVEQTDQSIPLSDYVPATPGPVALVFGNEIHGIGDDVLQAIPEAIEIPQYGTKHSLNVAVTAGIVLWEICRDL